LLHRYHAIAYTIGPDIPILQLVLYKIQYDYLRPLRVVRALVFVARNGSISNVSVITVFINPSYSVLATTPVAGFESHIVGLVGLLVFRPMGTLRYSGIIIIGVYIFLIMRFRSSYLAPTTGATMIFVCTIGSHTGSGRFD